MSYRHKCTKCYGSGEAAARSIHGRPMKPVPCIHCGGTGREPLVTIPPSGSRTAGGGR